jgi:hypothetical protein
VLLNNNKRAARWLAILAVCVVALGSTLVGAGVASASARVNRNAHIKFYNKQRVVTMTVPLSCPNVRQPPCTWMLYVNEPENPAQTVVGTATSPPGSGKVLHVNYPRDFCGVIQADVVVGPSPWLFEQGRIREVNTAVSAGKGHNKTQFCPTTPTTSPPTTTGPHPPGGGGNGQGGNQQASSLPFTGTTTAAAAASSGSPASVAGASDAGATATSAPATLPFTGVEVQPLIIAGAVLILLGGYILSTLEQRRRVRRRVAHAMNASAGYSSRASHWFLGD